MFSGYDVLKNCEKSDHERDKPDTPDEYPGFIDELGLEGLLEGRHGLVVLMSEP